MKKILTTFLFLFVTNVYGSDGLNSELSHAAGGAVMAGAVAKLAEDYPNRAWIGFGVSTAFGVVSQGYEMSVQNAKFSSSLLDAGSHALGSAIGAWGTDKYLLMPIVSPSYSGVMLYKQF